MMFERNKAFWTLFSVLTLLLLIVVYVLDNLQEESRDHEFETSVLSITPDEKIYFGRDPIARDDIARRINKFHEDIGVNHVLHILVDEDVPCGTVKMVIARVQQAGHRKVAVVVRGEIYMDHSPDPFESEVPVVPVDCSALPRPAGGSNPTSEVGEATATIPMVEAKDPATSGKVVTLNSKPLSLKQLSAELRGLLAHREMSVVYVKAPHNMAFLQVMEILKAVRQSGVRDIGLQIGCSDQK